jgi:1,4-dihydroxy-2-naphthoyl-CoA synthase
MGLVNWVFPDDRLHDKTLEVAKDICKTSKYAINCSKQNFYAQVEMTEWQAYMFAKEMMAQQAVSVNATEGFTAFLANRDPVWNDDTF